MIGYIILAATALATLGVILFRVWEWISRWGAGVQRLGGVRVRFVGDAANFVDKIMVAYANEEIREIIRRRFPFEPELLDYAVEIGGVSGGTIRTERMFPVTPRVFVAVVQHEHAAAYIAHEVARHILPLRRLDNGDPRHLLAEYAEIEREMKARITTRLGEAA